MPPTRRPISSRNTSWAKAIAGLLARKGVRPNTISVASAFFAAAAGGCLFYSGETSGSPAALLLVAAALGMQLRLLCNLFDGMVAVEGGFRTKSGEIFNELPDRFADAFILIGAGYALPLAWGMPWLGWLAAVLAVLTAYVRALGASAGASQYFCGPMAKPQRMALMTLASLVSAGLIWAGVSFPLMPWALGVIVLGCLVTVFRRARLIIWELEAK